MSDICMQLRLAALALSAALLSACQSGPAQSAWLMDGDTPYVAPDGQCVQVRPLAAQDKSGFCYEVMSPDYRKQHHYEPMPQDESAFLYPHVDPTPQQAQDAPPVSLAPMIAVLDMQIPPLPYMQQIYTALPFKFNNAHLSAKNRRALEVSFQEWRASGMQVVSVAITGHTDSTGPQDYNYLLSKWRAQSVAYFLQHLGVPADDIQMGGAGTLLPHPDAKRAADNRYVDLRVWLRPPVDSDRVAMR
ncbi:MAG TPA: OmpA family protein [Gammaproteobacteria bacterium]|nr:OmpA family protein [Gammaproteobacteria bacterium]